MDKLKTLFAKKKSPPKNVLPSLQQIKEIKKDVGKTMRKFNQQNQMLAQKIKALEGEKSVMDQDLDCSTCKKFEKFLTDKDKLNSLTDKQKQGAKIAYTRCGRCKENFCDTNTFETIDDLELCTMITHIFDDQELLQLLEIMN
jgi:hypothetical protein